MFDSKAAMRLGLAVILSGGMSLGLVACGKKDDATVDDGTAVETTDSRRNDNGVSVPADDSANQPSGTSSDSGDADGTEVTAMTTDDNGNWEAVPVVTFDSGWQATKTGTNDHVTVKDPNSSHMVTVDVFDNASGNPTTARALAEAAWAEAQGTGFVDDVEINGEIWSRYMFSDENGNGYAYHDNADGSIRKLSWMDCSFQDAVNALAEYDTRSASGEF